MLKKFIIFLIKFIVRRLNATARLINNFNKYVSLMFFLKKLKENYNAIKNLSLYKYFRSFFKVLGIINMLIGALLFVIFIDYKNIDLTIPALSWIFSSSFYLLPGSIQDFFFNIFIKIKFYIYSIYSAIKNFIIRILKNFIGGEESTEQPKFPNTESSKSSIPDGYHIKDEDLGDKKEKYNYITYILAGVVILSSGLLIYYYWSNISGFFKRGGATDGNPINDNSNDGEISEEVGSIPSDESTPNRDPAYYRYFKKSQDYLNQWKAKKDARAELEASLPLGITYEKGNSMWNGLPLPRTEYLEDGTEYYISMDQNKFVRIFNNKIESSVVDIINPMTNRSIGREIISSSDKNKLFRSRDIRAYYKAPEDSYIRNQLIESDSINTITGMANPSIEETSVDPSTLPGFSPVSLHQHDTQQSILNSMRDINLETKEFNNINLTPKASISNLPPIDPNLTPKANNIRLPGNRDSEYFDDSFNDSPFLLKK
jgi:hypothetical protein